MSTTKPHIYRFQGQWWLSRNGLWAFRRGITLNDRPLRSA